MAAFETNLIPWLMSQSSLQSLAGNRVFPAKAPDGCARPYIVWRLITGTSEYTHSGPAFREFRVQFSIFAETYTAAASIREVLLSLLDGKRHSIAGLTECTSFLSSVVHLYEGDSTKLHALHCDFTFSFAAE